MARPSVYVETSVVSYLAAWPSRDLITAAQQQITQEWWRRRRHSFDLFTSQLVLMEARAGDSTASARRKEILEGLPILEITVEARDFASHLMETTPLPQRAGPDALHIALATLNGMDYLLTWNCTHLANAELRPRIERACRTMGYRPPVLCTPGELMGELP